MKDVKGYEELYAVTSCGKVWSYRQKKFLRQSFDKDGYYKVNLYDDEGNSKTYMVHRLIAEAYIPNPEGKETVNHMDEVKTHNWIGNLTWMTRQENNNYGTRSERAARSHMKPVRCIETDEVFDSAKNAAIAYETNATSITAVCRGRRRTHKDLHWEYVKGGLINYA